MPGEQQMVTFDIVIDVSFSEELDHGVALEGTGYSGEVRKTFEWQVFPEKGDLLWLGGNAFKVTDRYHDFQEGRIEVECDFPNEAQAQSDNHIMHLFLNDEGWKLDGDEEDQLGLQKSIALFKKRTGRA